MTLMPGENSQTETFIADQKLEILSTAPEACRNHCPAAKHRAYEAAVYLARHGIIDAIKDDFTQATKDCPGPTEVTVCGAEEDRPTYMCQHPLEKIGQSIISQVLK
jgi:hypothetical protein